MRLGNAAWGLRETPLEEQLRITSAMGLDLLELSIAGYERDFLQLTASEAEINEVKTLFHRYRVRLECGCTGNDFTGDDVAGQVKKVRKVIEIAAALGISRLRIFAGFRSDSEIFGARFDRMIDALTEVAAFARSCNVNPVVETHGGVVANGNALIHFASVTTRVDYWPDLLKTGVTINYDPANFAAAGATDPVAFFDRFRDSVHYVHLKDFRDVPGGVVPAACGEGRLDWPKLLAALSSYDGPALIEYELPGDVEDGLRRSLRFLQQHQTKGVTR